MFLYDLILYVPSITFQLCRDRTNTKLALVCLAQGHNAVTPVRLVHAAPRSQVKHSTTEPLCSISGISSDCQKIWIQIRPSFLFARLSEGNKSQDKRGKS